MRPCGWTATGCVTINVGSNLALVSFQIWDIYHFGLIHDFFLQLYDKCRYISLSFGELRKRSSWDQASTKRPLRQSSAATAISASLFIFALCNSKISENKSKQNILQYKQTILFDNYDVIVPETFLSQSCLCNIIKIAYCLFYRRILHTQS